MHDAVSDVQHVALGHYAAKLVPTCRMSYAVVTVTTVKAHTSRKSYVKEQIYASCITNIARRHGR
jgi:hypothetical protein